MTSPENKVLVVEDDPAMLRFIRRTLEVDGHIVVTAANGLDALDQFRRQPPNLVVLDIGIPHIGGLEVCQLIQTIHPVPVIMVTARGDDEDIVRGFEGGAEDYLAKPFSGGVLCARVNALLRRSQQWPEQKIGKFECGEIVLDQQARRVTRNVQALHLTPTEYKLFTLLARYQGKVLTANQISAEVWGSESASDHQMLAPTSGVYGRKSTPVFPATPSSPQKGVWDTGWTAQTLSADRPFVLPSPATVIMPSPSSISSRWAGPAPNPVTFLRTPAAASAFLRHGLVIFHTRVVTLSTSTATGFQLSSSGKTHLKSPTAPGVNGRNFSCPEYFQGRANTIKK